MSTVLPSPVFVVSETLTIVRTVMARLLLPPRPRSVREEALAVAAEAVPLSICSPWVVRRSSRLEASLLKTIRSCSYARLWTTYFHLLLKALRTVSDTSLRAQAGDSLRSCSVTGAFLRTGLPSRLLLLATLSSSCFFAGVRGGMSVCQFTARQRYTRAIGVSRTVTCILRLFTVIIIRQAELLFLLIKVQLVVDALILVEVLVLHDVRYTYGRKGVHARYCSPRSTGHRP